MAIVTVKNPDLYRAWLAYVGSDTPAKRTEAFFNSQAGKPVPLFK